MTKEPTENRQLQTLRAKLDSNDFGQLIEGAVLDTDIDNNPMVGITVRLPRQLLQQAREIADQNETRVTKLIRHWVEQAVAHHAVANTPRAPLTDPPSPLSIQMSASWTNAAVDLMSHHYARKDEFYSIVQAMTKNSHLSDPRAVLR